MFYLSLYDANYSLFCFFQFSRTGEGVINKMFLAVICYSINDILNKEHRYYISPKSSICFDKNENKTSVLYIETKNESSLFLYFDDNKHDNIKATNYMRIRKIIPSKLNKFCICYSKVK